MCFWTVHPEIAKAVPPASRASVTPRPAARMIRRDRVISGAIRPLYPSTSGRAHLSSGSATDSEALRIQYLKDTIFGQGVAVRAIGLRRKPPKVLRPRNGLRARP